MLDLTSKYYPREVYSTNISVTMENKRKYDERIDHWYDVAEKMYPNFYKMKRNSIEKQNAIEAVNKAVGYER